MYDIAIIGAGPGGYIAAIRASQLGAKVVLIEKELIGGTCLNKGCIPSKTIIHSANVYSQTKKLSKLGVNVENISLDYSKVFERKNSVVDKIRKSLTGLIKSHNIDIIEGNAEVLDKNTLIVNEDKIEFKNLIIATGSKPSELPDLKTDNDFILNSDMLLNLEELPKSMLIIGSGAIGLEWATMLASFDVKIYLVELAPNILPIADIDVSTRVERILKRQRIDFYKGTSIQNIEDKKVSLTNGVQLEPDKILVAAGRAPVLFGLEKLNLEMNGKFIKVDNNLKTNIDNVYAIGDVTGYLQLAHTASHQGLCAVENILLNKNGNINYRNIPSIVYTNPEIASVGYTQQQLDEEGHEYKVSNFPMAALGKAQADDEIEGFVKILSVDNKIAGAHIIGAEASALIHQLSIAINAGLGVEELKDNVFAHPTYSEAVFESLLGLDNMYLSLPPVN